MDKTFQIFNNMMSFSKSLASYSKYQYIENESYNAYISGLKSPVANYVQFHKPDTAYVLKLKEANIPFIAFKSEKFIGDFDKFAQENNFVKDADYTAQSLVDLKSVKEMPAQQGVTFKQVKTVDVLADADLVAMEAFQAGESIFSAMFADNINNKDVVLCVAYYDDQPAGMAMIYVENNRAGCYWVGVRPVFQNKRIGTSLSQYMLNVARDLGADEMVVQNNSR